MFDNSMFEKWLDQKAEEIVEKMGKGIPLSSEEMIVLVLKAQSNHFHHLDTDLRNDMKTLREDMTRDMKTLREDMAQDMKTLREDMNRRFNMMFVFTDFWIHTADRADVGV